MPTNEETFFLNKGDFDSVKGRLKFENPIILTNFSPAENDVIALNFTLHSTPVIKGIELIHNNNFVPFWLGRFEKEGVTKEQIKDAFLQFKT